MTQHIWKQNCLSHTSGMCAAFFSIFRAQLYLWYRWFDICFFNELAQVYRMQVLNTGNPMGPYWMQFADITCHHLPFGLRLRVEMFPLIRSCCCWHHLWDFQSSVFIYTHIGYMHSYRSFFLIYFFILNNKSSSSCDTLSCV